MEGVLDNTPEPEENSDQEEKKYTPVIDPMAMAMCEYADEHKSLYRIYINPTDYELAEASTAAEAIHNAKSKPYKVLRESMDNYYSLPRNKVTQKADGTTLYSDVALASLEKQKDFHSFDVDSFQETKVAFEPTDYMGLAEAKPHSTIASTVALDEINHTVEPAEEKAVAATPSTAEPKSDDVAEKDAPLEDVAAEASASEPVSKPEASGEDALSPEEVAELLGEGAK